MLQIERVSTAGQRMKILVYGPPGIGKTTFAVTGNGHPDMNPTLVLNLEGGLLSVASRGDVDSVRIENTAQMDEAFMSLHQRTPPFDQYKTVVIDSGSEFANRALQEWTARNMARQARKGRGDADRTLDDVQLEDYGKMTNQIRRIFSWFRDLPLHVIVTALDKNVYPPNADQRVTPPSEVRPAFTDALGTSVMGMFDHVWYMYQDAEAKRYLLTQRQGVYHAKTRGANFSAAIGSVVANPNLATLYATLIRSENVQPSGADNVAGVG